MVSIKKETVTIQEVSERIGLNKEAIRIMLRNGEFPIGFAFKNNGGKWSYCIPRLAFEKWMAGEIVKEPPSAEEIAKEVLNILRS